MYVKFVFGIGFEYPSYALMSFLQKILNEPLDIWLYTSNFRQKFHNTKLPKIVGVIFHTIFCNGFKFFCSSIVWQSWAFQRL